MDHVLSTARLVLRRFRSEDEEAFARMNADEEVMEHFPSTLTRAESDVFMKRIDAAFDERGFGLWAIEIPGRTAFAGFVGLSVPRFEAHFTPCVEVGWRLGRAHWGLGFATEGAQMVLRHGLETQGFEEIVAFTVPGNLRSRRVMEKLGMRHDPVEDFDHPSLPEEHRLRRHVLYRARSRVEPG